MFLPKLAINRLKGLFCAFFKPLTATIEESKNALRLARFLSLNFDQSRHGVTDIIVWSENSL